MSTKENKAIVRRYTEEAFNRCNMESTGQFIAEDVVDHSAPTGMPPGLEGAKQTVDTLPPGNHHAGGASLRAVAPGAG